MQSANSCDGFGWKAAYVVVMKVLATCGNDGRSRHMRTTAFQLASPYHDRSLSILLRNHQLHSPSLLPTKYVIWHLLHSRLGGGVLLVGRHVRVSDCEPGPTLRTHWPLVNGVLIPQEPQVG